MGVVQDLRLAPIRPFEDPCLAQVFRLDGEIWTIASADKQIHLRDLRGLHYLATLLRDPGRAFHVCDLMRSDIAGSNVAPQDPSLSVVRGLGGADPCIDAQARAAYLARLHALDAEESDAERRRDLARLAAISDEREALLAELEGALRRWRELPHAERARVAVTKAIKTAVDKILARHPELGAHLSVTVRRGYFCRYLPDPRAHVEWET